MLPVIFKAEGTRGYLTDELHETLPLFHCSFPGDALYYTFRNLAYVFDKHKTCACIVFYM